MQTVAQECPTSSASAFSATPLAPQLSVLQECRTRALAGVPSLSIQLCFMAFPHRGSALPKSHLGKLCKIALSERLRGRWLQGNSRVVFVSSESVTQPEIFKWFCLWARFILLSACFLVLCILGLSGPLHCSPLLGPFASFAIDCTTLHPPTPSSRPIRAA